MLEYLQYERNNYLALLFWIALGMFTGPLVYIAIPVHMLLLRQRGQWLWVLLGFWLILTLSDSRHEIFAFAKNLKVVAMLSLSYLSITSEKEDEAYRFITPFIPFLILAFISLTYNPRIFYSFQKTLSYLLLLLVIPGTVQLLLRYERRRFLYGIVVLGALIMSVSLLLIAIVPDFVFFNKERFSGLLGNPNGMGMYGFLFLALFTYVRTNHPTLFTRKEVIFVYGIIVLSLILAGSRGGIFSVLLFLAGWQLIRRNPLLGFIAMAMIFASYQLVMANFEEIVISLGLQDYFRLETLETGSGRVVVADVAWQNIHQNYWFSKGFTYNETILAQYKEYFVKHGHQGNVHNSWLTMWLDTGLTGLILFAYGWLKNFIRAAQFTPMVWALLFGMLLSISVESWLTASLNPFTIQLVIILSMLSDKNFYEPIEEQEIVSSD
ncbi:O-antigen ligase family protein [Geofilum sp. OHC36d9]|uniref:O-antigen ligase family protein n=1 Tax=Geofilum sp. OHC36d9 TaxID=3458413 RepID=UPI004033F325